MGQLSNSGDVGVGGSWVVEVLVVDSFEFCLFCYNSVFYLGLSIGTTKNLPK